MNQLEARPLGIFLNCGYGIYNGSQRIAKIKFDQGWFNGWAVIDFLGVFGLNKGYRGWVITSSERYRVQQTGKFLTSRICLLQGKTPIAEAQDRIIPPAIRLEHRGQEYRLELGAGREFRIMAGNQMVGSVKLPKSWLSRKVSFYLPRNLPLTSQLLLIWMYLDRHCSD